MIITSLVLLLQPLSSPVSSPQKDKYSDRFIPSRAGAQWHINFNLTPVSNVIFIPVISSTPHVEIYIFISSV